MNSGTVQYSSVWPLARYDDVSFETLKEMEKTAERRTATGAENEK